MGLPTLLIIFLASLSSCSALLPGLYCGEENCYDVLNITRDSISGGGMRKKYRKLAAYWHPDRWKEAEDKEFAKERFQLVATAFETLNDEEVRKEYDYLLDNPDELFRHYWYYYKRKVSPKVDVRLVILGAVLSISIIQYLSAKQKYSEAISYALTQPRYRLQAVEIAKERGLIGVNQKKGKKRKDKEEIREEEEAAIKSIIEENLDIKGGYKKENLKDTLVVQLVIFPYTIYLYIKWWVDWIYRFWIKKEEYGDEEKLYIIRKNLKLSQDAFDYLGKDEHQKMLKQQLWIREKFDPWKLQKDEDEKQKLAESAQHKRFRRYMKNHGPGQISFVDEDY